MTDGDVKWPGVLDPSQLHESVLAASHHLADAGRAGDWPEVFRLLDADDHTNILSVRPGGKSWFTVLHQAAWHGASSDIITGLLVRGALRTLRDAQGRTPQDIALERNHSAAADLLTPPHSALGHDRVRALDHQLAKLIDSRITEEGIAQGYNGVPLRKVLRYPPVEILHELPGQQMWFPVPGMHGGFHVQLRRGYLEVASWIRVIEGSGRTHVITHEGSTLVEEGYV